MCSNDFSDLDSDLDDVFGPAPAGTPQITEEQHAVALNHLQNARHEKPAGEYTEECPKCHGSGRFVSYTGRIVGNCFHCKGAGTVTYKTSPEERAKGKQQRQALKEKKAAEAAKKAGEWFAANLAETKWIAEASARGFDFATAMRDAVLNYGSLTEKQLAAVHRCMAQDNQRDKERAEIAERAPDIKSAALDKIHTAFENAIDKDIKYPKMRLDEFLFSLVRSGQNAGAIYVKSIAKQDGERRYLGKIVEGRFFKGWKVSEDEQQRIVAAASDPEAAAIAYGRREGACSICGRGLTNHESIDRGIGPICAENYFG